jgi:GDPmannose 4,6-dehydratase
MNLKRGETFVTRKNMPNPELPWYSRKLYLGNLKCITRLGLRKRLRGMYVWLMLQQEIPDDYVIATRNSTFSEVTLSTCLAGIELEWQGKK